MLMSILSLVFGAIGLGYAISTLAKRRIEIYSMTKREIIEYTGDAAQVASMGVLIASLGLLIIGVVGFAAWYLIVVVAIVYYGAMALANRMKDST